MRRRDFTKAAFLVAAAERYARAARGLPELKITEVRAIPTSAGGNYQWVFLKVMTSEPGLYGIGSASNINQGPAIVTAIKEQYAPFWIGKNPDRIEDLWQSTNVRTYWRNSTIQNNILSGLDMALWDIKGKRAGMPVFDLLGGKARDAVPLYAHADGRDPDHVVRKHPRYMDEGYRHVRAQMGGYGGGGMIAPGKGSRPETGFKGAAFDEDVYLRRFPSCSNTFAPSWYGGEAVARRSRTPDSNRRCRVRQTHGAIPHVLCGGHSAAGADRLVSPHQAGEDHTDGDG